MVLKTKDILDEKDKRLRIVSKEVEFPLTKKDKDLINTMIIGAGDAGRLLINEINSNQANFANKVLCVIDDDANKIKSYIMGIPV